MTQIGTFTPCATCGTPTENPVVVDGVAYCKEHDPTRSDYLRCARCGSDASFAIGSSNGAIPCCTSCAQEWQRTYGGVRW